MSEEVLKVNDLTVTISDDGDEFSVVHHISFSVKAGETLGIVGESGCGKSMTSLAIMRLLPEPPAKIKTGEIIYKGENLLSLSKRKMRDIRGNQISMIFQEPMTSLNPVMTIGKQLNEVILLHNHMTKKQAKERAIEMLKMVGIPRAEQIFNSHPHELSGGMRQRVMIAISLACNPNMLIADEPTTALDVTIQAQILHLMNDLKQKMNTSILFITHDLGVVAEMCDRVIVMYAGEIVEEADVDTIFNNPKHPYTKALLASIPKAHQKEESLYYLKGQVPTPNSERKGCRFQDRCSHVMDICQQEHPSMLRISDTHTCRCLLYTEEGNYAGQHS
ncbi:ABC transporter ATP-binding protein [Bacillus sp. HMF5848]|uniref:ABC transporter ATP-binding protein n=1 Tax=Bacillus sp. HMF5848 TaxID=2495421 RepID=UPI000F78CBCE|nr:ABC transporter ATP-binding protein [Bacillus sp. HMF5848]RSK27182.1 ABC transporter ATP-binding protein [Bacillus sp. HMF5848]